MICWSFKDYNWVCSQISTLVSNKLAWILFDCMDKRISACVHCVGIQCCCLFLHFKGCDGEIALGFPVRVSCRTWSCILRGEYVVADTFAAHTNNCLLWRISMNNIDCGKDYGKDRFIWSYIFNLVYNISSRVRVMQILESFSLLLSLPMFVCSWLGWLLLCVYNCSGEVKGGQGGR